MEVIVCFNCSKFSINIVSATISLFIVLIIELFSNINNLKMNLMTVREENNLISINEEILIRKQDKNEWKIEISKINLKANIAEGTTEEILDVFVGHFEETPKEVPAPFKFKVGSKYYFDETDAYNAVETELLNDVSSNLSLVRELAYVMSQYALMNKNYTDYVAKEKKYKEDIVILDGFKKDDAVLKRQKGYMDRLNEKIIEALNLEPLTDNNVAFAFKDLFDKNSFIISYKGNAIEEASYAEQVNAGIILTDYLLTYLGYNYPIFIDNAECITTLPKVDDSRQLISMQVAYGYELSVYGEKSITEVKTLKTMPKVDKASLVKTRILGSAFDLAE